MAVRRPLVLINGQRAELPAGDTLPGSDAGGTAAVPLRIASGETYTVPANSQVLYRTPIRVDGALRVDGVLVRV